MTALNDSHTRAYGERTRYWAAAFTSETEYANPARYFGHRLEIFQSWGLRPKPDEHVLQIGCGDGYMARLLLQQGYRVTACDHAPEFLEKTEVRNREFVDNGRLTTRRVDINALPFPLDEQYDHTLAVMRSLFMYATNPSGTLDELRRVTTKRIIFDFNPREVSQQEVLQAVNQAGFTAAQVRAFLVPQKRSLPSLIQAVCTRCETSPLLYRPVVKRKFHLWLTAQ